jgi:hypothetical protein
MKICSVRAQLFYADGQTNRHDEANNRFTPICKRSKKRKETTVHNNKALYDLPDTSEVSMVSIETVN